MSHGIVLLVFDYLGHDSVQTIKPIACDNSNLDIIEHDLQWVDDPHSSCVGLAEMYKNGCKKFNKHVR